MVRVIGIAAVLSVLAGLVGIAPPAGAAPNGCGPDQAAAVQSALAQFPADPATGYKWSSKPQESNYDPCADLSAVVVTVEGATGSSPDQALLFHRGTYTGTGTLKAYPFTHLVAGKSTKDTVVLSYAYGKSCTACDDGKLATVRYRWNGTKVQMLDPPPPSS